MTLQITSMGIIIDEFAREYFMRFKKGILPVDVVEKIVELAGTETRRCSGENCHNHIVKQKQKYGNYFLYAFYVVEGQPICYDCAEGEVFDIVTLNLY